MKPPMSDAEFHQFLDATGHLVQPQQFRLAVYQCGVEASLRRVVWRHLLNVYPNGMSGRQRFDYFKRKTAEYYSLRDEWRDLFVGGKETEEIKYVTNMVKKDVLRTDRTHPFYAGDDDSGNVLSLFNLLVTYALTHPDVSYCQGMSDIASPILVIQNDEAHAYITFCGAMKRLKPNFSIAGEAMTTKFSHLALILRHNDPLFYAYMKAINADDMFFCYRWLLLELKREFPFDDALYMLETMWSSLPPDPPEEEISLFDPAYKATEGKGGYASPTPTANQAYMRLRSRRSNEVSPASVSAVTPCEGSIDPKDFQQIHDHTTASLKGVSHSIDKSLTSSSSSSPSAIQQMFSQLSVSKSTGDINGASKSSSSTSSSTASSPTKKVSSLPPIQLPKPGHVSHSTSDESPKRPTDIAIKPLCPQSADAAGNAGMLVSHNGVMTERTVELNSCEEALGSLDSGPPSIDFVKVEEDKPPQVPPPHEFGSGNPFLIFMCLSLLLRERDHIMAHRMDYNDLAMYFDKMVRKHNVHKVLHTAKSLYAVYLRQQAAAAMDTGEEDDINV